MTLWAFKRSQHRGHPWTINAVSIYAQTHQWQMAADFELWGTAPLSV